MTLVMLLIASGQIMAQTRTITGKVTDATGNPLPNVSVVIKGSNTGTTTAADGTWSLKLPAGAKVVIFSTIGMETVERTIGTREKFEISLVASDKNLQDVVVVGYGIQQKTAFTGSASKVDAKGFSNLVTPSVDKQLAGRAAGVQVTTSGGLVNSPAVIRIRGTQSISQGNDPLIVVDGVPIISGNLSATTNSNTLGDINPADIESIDILKDGSATAIYGSRGAPGVIQITTKKGTRGRAKVTYDGVLGISNPLKKFSLLNAKQFETIVNEKYTNAGLTPLAGVNTAVDTANTDWQSTVMIKNALSQSHTVSVQGGSEKVTYYMSLNYSDNKGIIISNYNRAYRVRANLDYEANKFVKIGANMAISRQEDGDQNNGSNSLGGAIASAIRLLPNVSPYSATGYLGYNIDYPNSNLMTQGPNNKTIDDNFFNVAFTLRNNKQYSDKYRILADPYIEVSPIKGLKLRSQVGIDMLNDYAYQGWNLYHGDGYGTGLVYNAAQNWLRLVWSSYFTYNVLVNGHNFTVTGGYEPQKQTYKWFSANGSNISDGFYIQENVISSSASTQSIGGNYDKTGFASTFGRFNYDYHNKYFVQASFRRDGQSALAPGKRYGTFPGFSVGWRPSQETFWQGNSFLNTWINEAKLKASYAKVGLTLGGYPYLTTFGNTPYGNLSGLGATGVGNADLQWETSKKYDAGIELGIWKNRFTFTGDWFLNDVNNLVLAVPTPLSAGIAGSTGTSGGAISQNVGTLRNNGIELSLSANIIAKKDFSWSASFNYSHIKNKILSLYPIGGVPTKTLDDGVYNLIRVGDPTHLIYGYRYAGVNTQNGNPMFYKADGSLVQLSLAKDATKGSFYVANSKDDGSLGAQSSLSATDKTNLGQGVPTWFGAFINNISYKGFAFEIMLRYSGGNKIMNITRQDALFNMSFQNNGTEILNRWTAPGQVTDVPKVFYGQAANISQSSNSNSRFVEDGKYLRLQNVVLSYNLDPKMLGWSNGYIRSVKAFVQGQNLHVWSKYKGADPDNINTQGLDAAVSPQVKTISFGLSVGF